MGRPALYVAAAVLGLAACLARSSGLSPVCGKAKDVGLTCAPCDVPDTQLAAEKPRLASAAQRALLRAEMSSGTLSKEKPSPDGVRYYVSDTPIAQLDAEHLQVMSLGETDHLLGPERSILIHISLDIVGFSGRDGVLVGVTVVERQLIAEDNRVLDLSRRTIYCVTRDGRRYAIRPVISD